MSIKRKQAICLDAIESSFVMAEIAHGRMLAFLEENAGKRRITDSESMVLDAWTLVDVAKRLLYIMRNTPGLAKSASMAEFEAALDAAVDFRHYIQHLEERLTPVASTGWPIWGAFSWLCRPPDRPGMVMVTGFIPGRIAIVGPVPVVNPATYPMRDGTLVDHIQLTADGNTVDLSDLARAIAAFKVRYIDTDAVE
jgi:hypothetical protein